MNTLKTTAKLSGSIFGLFIALMLFVIPLTFWTQYQLSTIFTFEIVFWQMMFIVSAVLLFLPKCLNGLPLFALVIGQMYIWFFL